jgi:hypothetical protein
MTSGSSPMSEFALTPFYQIEPIPQTLFARLAAAEASLAGLSNECTQLTVQAQAIQQRLVAVSALLTTTYAEIHTLCGQADTLAATAQGHLAGRVDPLALFHQIAATREVLNNAGWPCGCQLPPPPNGAL